MNQVNVLLGYDPKSTIYPRTNAKGEVKYYLRYYLPGRIPVSYTHLTLPTISDV